MALSAACRSCSRYFIGLQRHLSGHSAGKPHACWFRTVGAASRVAIISKPIVPLVENKEAAIATRLPLIGSLVIADQEPARIDQKIPAYACYLNSFEYLLGTSSGDLHRPDYRFQTYFEFDRDFSTDITIKECNNDYAKRITKLASRYPPAVQLVAGMTAANRTFAQDETKLLHNG